MDQLGFVRRWGVMFMRFVVVSGGQRFYSHTEQINKLRFFQKPSLASTISANCLNWNSVVYTYITNNI